MRTWQSRPEDAHRRSRVWVALGLVILLAGSLAGCEDAQLPPVFSPGSSPGSLPGSSAGLSAGALDGLIATLRDGTQTERAQAADDLARLADPAAIPALATALADEDWTVRWRAAEALTTLNDERAVDALLDLVAVAPKEPAVSSDDLETARSAYEAGIKALGLIGDPRAVPRLVEIAAVSESSTESDAAGDALGAFGDAALPGITAAMKAAGASRAALIVPLMARLGETGLAPLKAALGDRRPAVRIAAAMALAGYGGQGLSPLLGALKATDRNLRIAAANALGEVGDPAATAALVRQLADPKMTSAVTRALVRIHADDGTPLVGYLKSRKTVGVYRAVIRIGDGDTVAPLVKALKSFGSKTMGEAYLNCGNPTLEKAAKAWAKAHGYTVVTSPGTGSEAWGSG